MVLRGGSKPVSTRCHGEETTVNRTGDRVCENSDITFPAFVSKWTRRIPKEIEPTAANPSRMAGRFGTSRTATKCVWHYNGSDGAAYSNSNTFVDRARRNSRRPIERPERSSVFDALPFPKRPVRPLSDGTQSKKRTSGDKLGA